MKFATAALLAFLMLGCASGEGYYRLEEYGEGWQLHIVERERSFEARWRAGDNRSAKLVNYYDDKGSDYIIVNTLYLELDEEGDVVEGRLKRIPMRDFERQYYTRAGWFRVLGGTCVLDEDLNGTLDVRCEGGYVFKGEVTPMDNLETIRPE